MTQKINGFLGSNYTTEQVRLLPADELLCLETYFVVQVSPEIADAEWEPPQRLSPQESVV